MKNLEKYDTAYAEVIEVLNYIPLVEYNKIPKDYITFLEENCDENCSFVYNIALPFEKQNISDDAKNILGMIFRLFINSKEKNHELNIRDNIINDKQKIENQKKYNDYNKLFENNNLNNNITENDNMENQIIVKKDSLINRILNRIKKFFIN